MRIVFMGTPRAAVPSLERLLADGHIVDAVWTQPDRPAGRGRKLSASPVKQFALDHGIEVLQPEKVKNAESLQLFKEHKADVAVVAAYGRILPKTFLEAFPFGCINVHFSLLPKFRGAAPVNWAIVKGETVTGVTTMQMDEGLDTGNILLQRETEIGPSETAVELTERLAVLGAEVISETLKHLKVIVPRKQDDSVASLAPLMSKEDGRIDWSLGAGEIERRVRGFQPFPKSFTTYGGDPLTIWSCKESERTQPESDPGTVLSTAAGVLKVTCGAGTALDILELQMQGKKRVTSKDFVNGYSIKPGDMLGT